MQKLLTVFRIPELRRKIWFTLGLLAIYRLGFWVPLPIVDQEALARWAANVTQGQQGMGQLFMQFAIFSGTDLGTSTIFGLGIMPYISASIIMQLLASVIPTLEKLQKEGEVGRKKINEYTRYATVGICILQSYFWVRIMMNYAIGGDTPIVAPVYQEQWWFYGTVAVMVMTAGTIFLMWIGEQIDEYGIGNGISLIIMAGIIGRLPDATVQLWRDIPEGGLTFAPSTGVGVEKLLVMLGLFIMVIVGVIWITQGQRRIPTQSAKHVRGRRVFGGTRQYLPLRVNQAGVMPIIFASSLLIFPTMLFGWVRSWPLGSNAGFLTSLWNGTVEIFQTLHDSFTSHGYIYTIGYIALIYFFCYFWTAITFNPKDMANNLKDYGSFVPGYRPGRRTADYLERVMLRITYVGAAFLAAVAIVPTLVNVWLGVDWVVASFFGGTSLLIMISVALDLVQKIDSHLIMRNYESLLGPKE
jgi:preprotein translocase subunit SecY